MMGVRGFSDCDYFFNHGDTEGTEVHGGLYVRLRESLYLLRASVVEFF